MPPGEWGGLWLLRKLSAHGIMVDTLVLSGEAGQAETIEAIRLGARDFLVKDNAASELADRVREALAQGLEARSMYAASQLPTPVALPYQRMRVPSDPDAQLRASLTTAEAILRSAHMGRSRSGAPTVHWNNPYSVGWPCLAWVHGWTSAVGCGRSLVTMHWVGGSGPLAVKMLTLSFGIETTSSTVGEPLPQEWKKL